MGLAQLEREWSRGGFNKGQNLLILTPPSLVCWIDGYSTVIIKLSGYWWILCEYMCKIMIIE